MLLRRRGHGVGGAVRHGRLRITSWRRDRKLLRL
jgi:hypothetical protein